MRKLTFEGQLRVVPRGLRVVSGWERNKAKQKTNFTLKIKKKKPKPNIKKRKPSKQTAATTTKIPQTLKQNKTKNSPTAFLVKRNCL